MFNIVQAVCVTCFNIGLAIWTIPFWALLMVCLGVIRCFPTAHQDSLRQRFSWFAITGGSVAWRIATLGCCWVHTSVDGYEALLADLDKQASKPRVLLSNHLSFVDVLFASILFPLGHVGQIKMMASEHLFKLPVLGGMLRAMQHVCIPFNSQGENDFQVDRVALPALMQEMEDWIMAGHIGCWFPEGQTNRGDPTVLQAYRAGGFGICVRNDVEIWCNVFAGNTVCWPRTEPVGGRPCRVHLKVFKLCDSSLALLREANLDADADERAKCLWMATHAQEVCQAKLTEIAKEGWASDAGEEARLIADTKLP